MKHITTALASMLASLVLLVAVTPATAQMGSDAERLQAYIEQTGEILARAADFVADAPNPRSLRILEEARYSHRRSMEHAMAGQGRMAFAHSQRAREGVGGGIRSRCTISRITPNDASRRARSSGVKGTSVARRRGIKYTNPRRDGTPHASSNSTP